MSRAFGARQTLYFLLPIRFRIFGCAAEINDPLPMVHPIPRNSPPVIVRLAKSKGGLIPALLILINSLVVTGCQIWIYWLSNDNQTFLLVVIFKNWLSFDNQFRYIVSTAGEVRICSCERFDQGVT